MSSFHSLLYEVAIICLQPLIHNNLDYIIAQNVPKYNPVSHIVRNYPTEYF
nr:MAG TPA: hypothetical protein [Caudoviricetes sp.]